jgi:RND family efflux transporter MFP subunit
MTARRFLSAWVVAAAWHAPLASSAQPLAVSVSSVPTVSVPPRVLVQPVAMQQPGVGGDDSRIRIQLVSRDEVDVSSEIAGKIASLPFRDGDAFRAGQLLASLDCSLYAAQLHKSQAEAQAARDTLRVDTQLAQLHSVGQLEVEQAEGKAKASAADVAYMQATVRKCAIAAPFNGRVSKRSAAPEQFVEPGKPLLTIVDTSHLELKMIVPSKWLAWLKTGRPLTVHVEEIGKTYDARVARIGARVDPVTQTVDVTAALVGEMPELLPGMSGWATFAMK